MGPNLKVSAVGTAGGLNREAWLTELAKRCEGFFRGLNLAPYRLTCGWPSTKAIPSKSVRLGECHGAKSSKAGLHELFISPLLADSIEVAGVVVHEMAHVAAGIEAGHGKAYARICAHVGLTAGKPTTASPGPFLLDQLHKIVAQLGAYPHVAMTPGRKVLKASADVRLVCKECECRVVMSAKWFASAGPPVCGCGGEMLLKGELDERG